MASAPGVAVTREWPLLVILGCQGYTLAINGVAAPWIMDSFALGETGLARLFAVVAVSAIGAFLLARLADRTGRRPALLWCLAVTPVAAAGAAVAPTVELFAAFEIVMASGAGAAVTTAVVLLAEQTTPSRRASGQGGGGVAVGVGACVCVVLMPLLVAFGLSWRLLLWTGAVAILVWPLAFRRIPESRLWHPRGSFDPDASVPLRLFAAPYRRRTVALLASGFLSTAVVTGGNSWRYFHAVTVNGLSPAVASGLLLVASGLGLAGFYLGAGTSDRLGRVPTVAGGAVLMAVAGMCAYWGPPAGWSPVLWLALTFCGFTLAANGMTVGGNCSATELLPTAVRSSLMGWLLLVGAVAQLASQSAVAMLAERAGGISGAVGGLSLLGVGVAVIYALFVDETRGATLDPSAVGTHTSPW